MKISETIKNLAVGEKTIITGNIESVRVLCSRLGGYSVKKTKNGSHAVTRTGIRTASIAAAILQLIKMNTGHDQFVGFNPSQVRVAVSNYNRKTGRKLKVRDAEAGCIVFELIEDREAITMDDFLEIEKKYLEKLEILRKKIISEERWI